MSLRRRIVICGGGAIGAAIGYFVSRGGAQPIVIERHAVAGAASGKSGGFLALDWCRGTPLDRLARRSFALHAELSETLGDPWGYRRLTTFAGYAAENAARGVRGRPWLADGVAITGRIGTPQTTALVEPRAFTTGLVNAAVTQGGVLRPGVVVDLVRGDNGAVRGVALAGGELVEADAVVIAMGPWSILAARWLPLPPVMGYKGHSLVLETGGSIPAEALFLEYQEASGEMLTPELFPRQDGTTWVCAISTAGPVPLDPAAVTPDDGAWARLEAMCRNISPALATARRGTSTSRRSGPIACRRLIRSGCRSVMWASGNVPLDQSIAANQTHLGLTAFWRWGGHGGSTVHACRYGHANDDLRDPARRAADLCDGCGTAEEDNASAAA